MEVEQPVVAEMPATEAIPQIAVLDDDGDAGDADGQDLIARDQVHWCTRATGKVNDSTGVFLNKRIARLSDKSHL